jgi:hypothetical protein
MYNSDIKCVIFISPFYRPIIEMPFKSHSDTSNYVRNDNIIQNVHARKCNFCLEVFICVGNKHFRCRVNFEGSFQTCLSLGCSYEPQIRSVHFIKFIYIFLINHKFSKYDT